MIWLIAGLFVFLGVHSIRIVAPGVRERFIARRGEKSWKAVYATIASLGFVLLIFGYGYARTVAPIVFVPPSWGVMVPILLMWPAMILLVASNGPVSHIRKTVKHPMLLATKIWAFSHLFANGDLASLVLFVAFLAWAVVDRISVKRRGNPVFENVRVRNDIIAIVVGSALYIWFILHGHEWLIGVPPIA